MDGIAAYLDRFKRILGDKGREKDVVREIILSRTKLTIAPENISFQGDSILFDIQPSYRTELYIHREDILKDLKERGIHATQLR